MTAKEVLSVCFAHGTEENKKVDHTYEVVSLEANKLGQRAPQVLQVVGRMLLYNI